MSLCTIILPIIGLKVSPSQILIAKPLIFRPYKCPKCSQGFYRNNILKDHIERCEAGPQSTKPTVEAAVSQSPSTEVNSKTASDQSYK